MYVGRTSWAYYNEIDEYAAEWLENLIARGSIAPGVVDRRSIVDVQPDDLRGFRQCHFFAGIGVWSYALRRSGVPDDAAVWTGSCPCQPFSAAGQGNGVDDERHLWPALFHLIEARRPPRFYGEQVASKDGLGWLDIVQADLEGAGYSLWAVDTCSAGSGAPHIRQRLRLCADDLRSSTGSLEHASGFRWTERRAEPSWRGASSGCVSGELADDQGVSIWAGLCNTGSTGNGFTVTGNTGNTGELGDSISARLEGQRDGYSPSTGQWSGSLRPVATASGIDWVADKHADRRSASTEPRLLDTEHHLEPCSGTNPLANTIDGHLPQSLWRTEGRDGSAAAYARTAPNRPSPTNGFWRDADWLFCRDAKWRPVEPGTFPLVDGAAFRVGSGSAFEGRSRQGMLKGYGNAIDAEATIDFIEATLEPDTIDAVAASSLADLLA